MFLATPETMLAACSGPGGRLATRPAPVGLSSFRSGVGVRKDSRLGPPLLGGPRSAPESTVALVL